MIIDSFFIEYYFILLCLFGNIYIFKSVINYFILFFRQMFPVCDNNSHYSVTYETLKPVLASDTASIGYGKLENVPPPIGGASGKMSTINGANTTTPNICIEGGRIEFVKSPVDCGDEKQDYLKVI